MKPDTVMVFAAGLGTRMGELTRNRAKPLIEVAGRPLIAHALDLVRDAGVRRIVVNTHAHAAQMQAWLRDNAPDARISHEDTLLETGGGLKAALPLLGNAPVFTLNADMVWRGGNPLASLSANWEPERMEGLLCTVPRETATGHAGPGDFFIDADGHLSRRGDAAIAPLVYTGAQIIRTGALTQISTRAFSLNLLWNEMLACKRLSGTVYRGEWVDVGRPEGILAAESLLSA